jgi:hypothetical protein
MRDKRNHVGTEMAETLALKVLGFIASDPRRLQDFTAQSGIALEDLHQRAGDRDIHIACLNSLLHDESLLLMFCANAGVPPDSIAHAERILSDAPGASGSGNT